MATRIPLPEGWGEAWLHGAGGHRPKDAMTARSYDHLGRQLVWMSSAANGLVACDIESGTGNAVSEMASHFRLDEQEFRRRWVLAEVQAKLADVPVLLWLKKHGLPAAPSEDVQVCICRADAAMMAFGRRAE